LTRQAPKNLVASVRHRLLDLGRRRGDEFQLVLMHYAVERLLYRLSRSEHSDRFLLKGAMLLSVWTSRPYRSTRDLDLAGRGDSSTTGAEAIFRGLCGLKVEDDGLVFDGASVKGKPIREDQEYEGVRVTLMARLGNARIPLQVDIGFGDAVQPSPENLTYPTMLGFPAPQLKSYPKETVVAEKLQAMVALGPANSRMKDFYDVWVLARTFDFGGPVLCRTIKATFTRRATPLPNGLPYAFTSDFTSDRVKQTQWRAFLKRGRFVEEPPPFPDVTALIRDFVMPPLQATASSETFEVNWKAGGSWSF